MQPGGFGGTNVDTVDTEPHLEALTRHVARRLPAPDASAADEVDVLKRFWFRDYCNVGGVGRGPAATAGDDANRVGVGMRWACACDHVLEQGV